MDDNCQLVVFSDKAYNAIIRETFEWDPVETGGILLGHVLDNGCWIVMEVLPPGYGEGREGDNVFHEYAYFEYNQKFVNYLASSVAQQYEIPLELLGLWHRHPGSLDTFSGTDDGTNLTFAAQNPHGVISGLVNVDPQLRITMYYLAHNDGHGRFFGKPSYRPVDVEVGSDLIPEEYFKLRYYQGQEADLHPYAPKRHNANSRTASNESVVTGTPLEEVSSNGNINLRTIVQEQTHNNCGDNEPVPNNGPNQKLLSAISDVTESLKKNKRSIILILAFVAFICSLFSIKNDITKAQSFFDNKKKPLIEDELHKQKTNCDEDTIYKMTEKSNDKVINEAENKDQNKKEKDNRLPDNKNKESRSEIRESNETTDI